MKLSFSQLIAGAAVVLASAALSGCGAKSSEPQAGDRQMSASQPLPSQANALTESQNERKTANDAMRARDAK